MPLITSNTDLKSLSFGHDRPGGASSGQPFLFTGFNIPNVDFPSPNATVEQAYSGSAGFGIGQNFFDLPPITINAPTFGYTPGINSTSFTLFKGNGVDIATPIVKSLDATAKFITNGAEGAINAVIGAINNSFDTTRNPSSPDFLWRKNRFNIAHSFADTVRVTKFLTTPSGIFFIIKQELLERQNVKVDGYTRLYNPGSTIAQVGVNSIGYHLNKAGINPFERSYFKGGNIGYFDNARLYKNRFGIPNQPDTIGRGSNRLTLLTLSKINQENVVQVALAANNQYGVTPPESVDLLKYSGGPGSVLGIGDTNIRWQNPTRTVLLRRDKTEFSKITNESNYNYLTPIGSPNIVWYYNPNASTTTINGITKKISVYQSLYLSLPEDDKSKLFNLYFNGNINYRNNTNIVSSSLYSPPSLVSKGTYINTTTDDPTLPEYYTPLGDPTPIWYYSASIDTTSNNTKGVTSNYAKALENAGLNTVLQNNRSSIDPSPVNIGEFSTISSDTDIFGDKNNSSNNEFTLDGAQIANKNSAGKDKNTGTIIDFRKSLDTSSISSTNYDTFNRDKTYQTSKTSYKGNFIPGYGRVLSPNTPISPDQETPKRGSDIIDFNFTLHVPGVSDNRLIDFTAYIEDWSDGVKAEWNSIKYMGRAESFYKYGGFSREASVTFLVPALSRRDLIANYKKLNALAWSVSPSYSDIGLMRGVITYFTMGDYFRKMPTIIKSIDYAQIGDMGWDINRNLEGDIFTRSDKSYTGQLPKGIKVNISFTPLHQYTPQVGSEYIGYDPETVNSYPSIYTADPKGGQNAITSDSKLKANDRVPIPQIPGQSTTSTFPTQQAQQLNIPQSPLPGLNTSGLRSSLPIIEDENYEAPPDVFGPTDFIPNQYNTPVGPSTQFNDVVTPGENPNYGSGPINTGFNF